MEKNIIITEENLVEVDSNEQAEVDVLNDQNNQDIEEYLGSFENDEDNYEGDFDADEDAA